MASRGGAGPLASLGAAIRQGGGRSLAGATGGRSLQKWITHPPRFPNMGSRQSSTGNGVRGIKIKAMETSAGRQEDGDPSRRGAAGSGARAVSARSQRLDDVGLGWSAQKGGVAGERERVARVRHQDAAGSDAPKDHGAAGSREESTVVGSAFPGGRDSHHHHHHHHHHNDDNRIRGGGGSSMRHDGEEGARRVPDPGSEEGVWLDNARRRNFRSTERFGGRAEMTRHDHANSRGKGGGEGGVGNPHHISSSSSSSSLMSMSASTSSTGPRARQEWQPEKREDKEKHKYWFMSEQRAGANRRMTPPQVWLKRPLWGELPDGSPPPQAKKKLTARVWDSVMSQPDPTEALQEISRRAMLKDEDGGWVHDDLWWMREMIEIRYGEMDEAEQKKARSGKGKVLINHVVQVVKQAPTRLRVRWAALLHDVGKPSTMEVDTEKNKLRFHKHESVGGQMVDSILASYGYHEQFRREVATLVLRSGRIRCIENFHDQGARRLLSVSGPLFCDLLDLYKADCTSMNGLRQREHFDRSTALMELVNGVLKRDRNRIKRPPLDGHAVMAITGLKSGLALGRLMRGLRADYLLRGPYTHDEAVQVAQKLHREYQEQPETRDMRKKTSASVSRMMEEEAKEDGDVIVFRITLEQDAAAVGKAPWRDIAVSRKMFLFDFATAVVHAFDFDFDDRFSFFRRSRASFSPCPGAEAACSGIDNGLLPHRGGRKPHNQQQHQQHRIRETDLMDAVERMRSSHGGKTMPAGTVVGMGPGGEEAVGGANASSETAEETGDWENFLRDTGYELLASTPGIPKELASGGMCFSYDVRYSNELNDWVTSRGEVLTDGEEEEGDEGDMGGLWKRPGEERIKVPRVDSVAAVEAMSLGAANAGGPREEREGDADRLWGHRADTLAYPLKLPQKGPASLANTQVGSLFDRSRRSMVLFYENGGPWRFSINFVEERRKKPYEEPPQVCARMGRAPRQYVYENDTDDIV